MKMVSAATIARIAAPAPGTQVLRRAHDMLRLLALHAREGMRLSDIASTLSLEPPTAHRILQGLVQERMAVQDVDKRYNLGPALYELGMTAGASYPLRDVVQTSVEHLAKTTGDTLVVTVRSGLDSVCIERRTGAFPIQTSMVAIGTRRPLASGAGGLAIMACLDKDESRWLVEQNALQLKCSAADIAARIEDARRIGYAINTYRHTTPPISALGVPIMGAFGQCVAGLAIVALSMRLSGKRRTEVVELLRNEAVAVSRRLAQQVLPKAI